MPARRRTCPKDLCSTRTGDQPRDQGTRAPLDQIKSDGTNQRSKRLTTQQNEGTGGGRQNDDVPRPASASDGSGMIKEPGETAGKTNQARKKERSGKSKERKGFTKKQGKARKSNTSTEKLEKQEKQRSKEKQDNH